MCARPPDPVGHSGSDSACCRGAYHVNSPPSGHCPGQHVALVPSPKLPHDPDRTTAAGQSLVVAFEVQKTSVHSLPVFELSYDTCWGGDSTAQGKIGFFLAKGAERTACNPSWPLRGPKECKLPGSLCPEDGALAPNPPFAGRGGSKGLLPRQNTCTQDSPAGRCNRS